MRASCVAIVSTSGLDFDRLAWHLHNWSVFMYHRGNRLGYPSRASGLMGTSGSRDFEALAADADRRCAEACDAIIDSLEIACRAAIYAQHLGAAYRLIEPIEDAYRRACAFLARELAARGID